MGYFGKLKEKNKAQELRKHGFSYNEILTKIHVSKDTISRWCKDITLTDSQKLRLQNNKIFGQKNGSIIAAENKKRKRLEDLKNIYKLARKEINILNYRDKFITGIALYAGEGTKTDGQIGFSNSNPILIKFMMNWFRTYCKIPENKFHGALWIHKELDLQKALKYWSKLTGIPKENIYKPYITKVKTNSKKIRKNLHQFGVFSIRVSNSELHRKLIGWIYALFNDKMTVVH